MMPQKASDQDVVSRRYFPKRLDPLEQERYLRPLRRMKTIATTLLCMMAVLFLLGKTFHDVIPYAGLLVAFSEAAMIGALADWFAVVALFKHPLGIPIPHTAIIKSNKDKFGETLARFVKESFLVREALEEKLRQLDIAGWLAAILKDRQTVTRLSERIVEHLGEMLERADYDKLRGFIREVFEENLRRVRILPLAAGLLETLRKEGRHQAILEETLRLTSDLFIKNKDKIKEGIKRENPWWIPDFVDDIFLNRVTIKIEETLLAVRMDKEHDLRKKYDEVVANFINDLNNSDAAPRMSEGVKETFLRSEAIREVMRRVFEETRSMLLAETREPDSGFRRVLEDGITSLGNTLFQNRPMREKLNLWAHDRVVNFTQKYADSIITVISDTVRKWDAEAASRRIEMYAGKDLQWIRLNGTVVGGLVGLAIHLISHLF